MSILAWNGAVLSGLPQGAISLHGFADPALVISAIVLVVGATGGGLLLSTLRRLASRSHRSRPDLRVVRGNRRTARAASSVEMRDALVTR
jgi:hypothetical protein